MSTTAAMPYFEEDDGQGRALAVFARDDGKAAVQIEKHGNGIRAMLASFVADPLTAPDLCRAMAALIAACADAAEAWPSGAEVDELAATVAEAFTTGVGIAAARPLARKILLAGWKREAPGA